MSWRRSAVVLAGLLSALAGAASAAEVALPAGTRIQVRLNQHVYSHTVTPGQAVDTLVIAPVRVGDRVVVAPGWKLKGSVLESGTMPGREKRARLRLAFTKLVDESGTPFAVDGRVVEVDAARETIDADGRMIGVPPQKGLPRDKDALLRLAVQLDPVALGLLEGSGQTIRAAVGYDRGTEMTVELASAARVDPATAPAAPRDVPPAELKGVAASLPTQTSAAEPLTLLVAGGREDVEAAFVEAGYQPMDALWAKAAARAFLALAQKHGFAAPQPSTLDGQPAALAFEKQNNTLARRHRVRLWARGETFRGQPTWLGTALRCVDLVFDRPAGAFRYRIDPDTNAEREKVAQDLVTAKRVAARGLLERRAAPRAAATRPETDGRVSVLVLQ